MRTQWFPRLLLTVALGPLALALSLFPLPNARAATHMVTTDHDNGPGSLRDVILNASFGDTITFSGDFTITLASELLISTDLTIDGTGHTVTLNGNYATRVVSITAGSAVTLNQLRIVKGDASSGDGGGIFNNGSLTVTNSTLTDNQVQWGGGGAIYNSGTLALMASTLSKNWASPPYEAGGAIVNIGAMTVMSSSFSGNISSDGGGLFNRGTATVMNSIFSDNAAKGLHSSGTGGGIDNAGTLLITNTIFSRNYAGHGGGLSNSNILLVTSSLFADNRAAYGGGLSNTSMLSMSNSTVSSNLASQYTAPVGFGGGIYNAGILTLTNSTLSGNETYDNPFNPSTGGGIYNIGAATAKNTIIAKSPTGGNCYGDFTRNGSTNNLTTDSTCSTGFTQVTSGQLALGALTGTPAYFPVSFGSAAIDTGTNVDCPSADQAGHPRPMDGNGDGPAFCDVGAYEAPQITFPYHFYFPIIQRQSLSTW